MLLPSALPCDAAQTTSYPSIRPRLLSYRPYISQPKPQTSLQSTCNALQALLGGSPVQPATAAANTIYHPNPRDRLSTSRTPLEARRYNTSLRNTRVAKPSPLKASALPTCAATPGGKRRRLVYQTPDHRRSQTQAQAQQQDENTLSSPETEMLMTFEEGSDDDTMVLTPPEGPITPYHRPELPSIPLAMPMGLSTDDFVALSPPLTPPSDLDPHVRWSPSEDNALVQLVLEKMKLSTRQWNDCARTLGRDRNSLGARWKVLVHEGEVGLRRSRRTL